MPALIVPFAETVTHHAHTSDTTDDTGNTIPAYTDTDVQCAVWPTVSSESNQPQDVVTRGVSVLFAGIAPITGLDEFTVRGSRYKVDGDPDVYHSPLTGTEVTHVQLLRRT